MTGAPPPSPVLELLPIAREAMVLALANRVLKEDRPAMRALGERANAVAGLLGMQLVHGMLAGAWEAGFLGGMQPDDFHPGELTYAWDGIGGWLA